MNRLPALGAFNRFHLFPNLFLMSSSNPCEFCIFTQGGLEMILIPLHRFVSQKLSFS